MLPINLLGVRIADTAADNSTPIGAARVIQQVEGMGVSLALHAVGGVVPLALVVLKSQATKNVYLDLQQGVRCH